MFGRSKPKPTLIERVPTIDLVTTASALRDRASAAADTLAPHVEAAKGAVGPKVESARDSLAPHLVAALEALAPAVESARVALAPHVDAAKTTVTPRMVSALGAARQRAEQTASVTEPSRRELAVRSRLAAAALRGERPPRRGPSVAIALALGAALGSLAGALSRRFGPAPAFSETPSPFRATPTPAGGSVGSSGGSTGGSTEPGWSAGSAGSAGTGGPAGSAGSADPVGSTGSGSAGSAGSASAGAPAVDLTEPIGTVEGAAAQVPDVTDLSGGDQSSTSAGPATRRPSPRPGPTTDGSTTS